MLDIQNKPDSGRILNIGYVTASSSRAGGGLLDAVAGLANNIVALGNRLEVFSLHDSFTEVDRETWRGPVLHNFPIIGPRALGFSPTMQAAVAAFPGDLLHTQGIWMYPSKCTIAWRKRTRAQYVISPHGMLDPWILGRSKLKKRLAMAAYERRHLDEAACFHALNLQEADAIRALGYKQPIAVIPNGVVVPDPATPVKKPDWWNESFIGKRTLLYFGRLHPKKGVGELISAWARISKEPGNADHWRLVIAGWGDETYVRHLKDLAATSCLADRILFVGPQFGSSRDSTLAFADCVVLPSHSEGLPLVPLEAWARSKPVILTPGCNLSTAIQSGAAMETLPNVDSLEQALLKLISAPTEQLRQMGDTGLQFVTDHFSWPRIADQMTLVYRWLLDAGPRPASVIE